MYVLTMNTVQLKNSTVNFIVFIQFAILFGIKITKESVFFQKSNLFKKVFVQKSILFQKVFFLQARFEHCIVIGFTYAAFFDFQTYNMSFINFLKATKILL